jgi:Asp-tRNA(Asn)/Glu-tRNA(Gln) amidotransferase A subunit family amidase
MIGHSAISVPVGETAEGLAADLQIVAPPYQQARLLSAAALFERARPCATNLPLAKPVPPALPKS